MAGARPGAAPADGSTRRGTVHPLSTGAAPPPSSVVPDLYHFTCHHGAAGITAIGAAVPRRHPYFPAMTAVVWLTDLPWPSADDVGLTSRFLECDRLAFRFRVTEPIACVPWHVVVADAPAGAIDDRAIEALESYGKPDHWWVSPIAVPVVPDN